MLFNKPYLKLKDYFLTQELFELFENVETGVLKTVPQPENLERYYESEDYISHDDTRKTFFTNCYNYVKSVNLKIKYKLISGYVNFNDQIIDIGAGVGDLVLYCNERGLNMKGFEPSSKARDVAKNKGVHLLEDLKHQKANLVTMYHVLEHVSDVNLQIEQLYDILEDNGILILALPNYNSFDAKFFKSHWAGFDVPRHTFHFNKSSVEKIFANKFKLIESRIMWFDAFYVSILSAKYKKWPLAFLLGGIVGFLSNVNAIFTKQASSHVYILQKIN